MAKHEADGELEDEFDKVTKKAKKAKAQVEADDEDDAPAPKKKAKRPVVEDDEDDRPTKKKAKRVEEDDEDDRPVKKKAKRPVEDDEDEDDQPKKKKKGNLPVREASPETKALQARILKILGNRDSITNIELAQKLGTTTLKSQQLANSLIRKGKVEDKRNKTGRVSFTLVE